MLETLLDALIDSLRMLPLLLVVYLLLEFLEYKGVTKFEDSKLLKGKWSPVFGSIFGSVPQCGFSVISTDLYSSRKLSIGGLIAVYIATSDEAIPLMIADVKALPWLGLLLAVKIVFACLVGYLAMFLYRLIFKPRVMIFCVNVNKDPEKKSKKTIAENTGANGAEIKDEAEGHKANKETAAGTKKEEGDGAEHHENGHPHNFHPDGCCHHHIEHEGYNWKHPILHSLKIFAFILVMNVIFGIVVYYVGEGNLVNFLSSSSAFQPAIAVLIGLIPNCVSSVLITKLFLLGGLSFGSIVAGLSVNAGLGLLVLIKQNKNWKENLFIFLMLIIPSLLLGYLLHFII